MERDRRRIAGGDHPADPNGATLDTTLNVMFTNYANDSSQGSHWTGGDATISVLLPGEERYAWLFSDTYLGTVSNNTRPPSTPLIHNCIVVQQGPDSGPTLTTLTGMTDGTQTSLVGAPNGGYRQVNSAWSDAGISSLFAFYKDYLDPGEDGLAATPSDTWLATFSLPSLSVQPLTQLPVGKDTLWGSAVLDEGEGGYTYIYGNGNDSLFIARAPHGQVLAAGANPVANWTFWTGADWSPNEADAMPELIGLAGLTIVKFGSGYVLSAFDVLTAFDPNIVAYTSVTPYGQFTEKTYLYPVPPTPNCGNCYSYYPEFHQEFAASGELVLSYNTNTLNAACNDADASIYRPTFIDVPWPPPPVTARPEPPTGLAIANDGLNLTWTAPPTPAEYYVYAKNQTAGDTFPSRYNVAPTAESSVSLSFLTAGITYQFTVTTYNGAAESAPSAPLTATYQPAPPAPAGLIATSKGNGTISLTWTAIAGCWYFVQTSSDGGQTWTPPINSSTVPITTNSYLAEFLTIGTTYEFRVYATDVNGVGPASAVVSATA